MLVFVGVALLVLLECKNPREFCSSLVLFTDSFVLIASRYVFTFVLIYLDFYFH